MQYIAFIAVGLLILAIWAKADKVHRLRIAKKAAARELAEEKAELVRKEELRALAEREKQRLIQKAIDAHPGAAAYRLDKIQTETSSTMLNISEFTPISKQRYVAFDLETTGLSSDDDAIVEIGAVRVEDGRITAEYQQLIDPERPMPAGASAVNHITDDMLRGQPKIYEALPAFREFIGDDVLAAHNVRFDYSFIAQACMRNLFKVPEKVFDTMQLARYWPEAENKKLGSLIQAAGMKNDDAHRALGDARAVAALISATNDKRMNKQ